MERRNITLSERQLQVMQYLVNGLTVKEIALELSKISAHQSVSKGTVTKYIRRVRLKVGAKSLYQTIAILVATGIVDTSALDIPVNLRPTVGDQEKT